MAFQLYFIFYSNMGRDLISTIRRCKCWMKVSRTEFGMVKVELPPLSHSEIVFTKSKTPLDRYIGTTNNLNALDALIGYISNEKVKQILINYRSDVVWA